MYDSFLKEPEDCSWNKLNIGKEKKTPTHTCGKNGEKLSTSQGNI